MSGPARALRERQRILDENERRRVEVDAALYSNDDPAERLAVEGRVAGALRLLADVGYDPEAPGLRLEVGVGSAGWLPIFDRWQVPPQQQVGFDLDLVRVRDAHRRHPSALLGVGDGTSLPLADGCAQLVVTSTVFSSILDETVQAAVASEIERVLGRGGALVLYDLRVDNPRNPNVRGVRPRHLERLFPHLDGPVRSIGLAPPVSRRVAPRSPALARWLEKVPLLRTHLLAVLRKGKPPATEVDA
ncbi:MAG: class I SAM-dependent methyltransferase [Acidobacteriota bacterium]